MGLSFKIKILINLNKFNKFKNLFFIIYKRVNRKYKVLIIFQFIKLFLTKFSNKNIF